jgi:hypothetical protein
VVRDHARDGGGAIDAREDADVVACGDARVGAHDALEGSGRVRVVHGLDPGAEGVVALEVAHGEVVHVHVLARADRRRGEADDLVVAAHGLARFDGTRGELVPGWNRRLSAHALALDQRAGGNLDARNDDVVVGMQADGQFSGLQHRCTLAERLVRPF